MANVMRWRYGDTNPVVLPVSAETVIEIGDLVHQSGGVAFPSSTRLLVEIVSTVMRVS